MILLAQAQTVLTVGLVHARAKGLKPLGMVVLDAGGHLLAAAREDGATFFRTDIARAKAYGALGMGVDTAVIADRAKSNPAFYSGIVTTLGGDVVFSPGGVLVKDAQGLVVGAVGASGDTGDKDVECVMAGLAAAGF